MPEEHCYSFCLYIVVPVDGDKWLSQSNQLIIHTTILLNNADSLGNETSVVLSKSLNH